MPRTRFEDELSVRELADLHAKVRALSHLSPWRSQLALALDWATIAAAITCAVHFADPLVSVVAILVVGARQNALGRLMHEGAHERLSKSKVVNKVLSDWFCAFPLFSTTANFRESHLAHHRHLATELDPDLRPLGDDPTWTFPQSRTTLLSNLARQILLIDAFTTVRDRLRFDRSAAGTRHVTASRIAFLIVLFVALTVTMQWTNFFLYWIVPGIAVVPLLVKLRLVFEHFGLDWKHELETTRNVRFGIVGRFFVAPHSSGRHLDHHLYPSVPFYALTELHESLKAYPAYRRSAHVDEDWRLVVRGLYRPGSRADRQDGAATPG